MKPITPTADMLDAASQAVTELATVAFESEFLKWDKHANLSMVMFVWNVGPALDGDDALVRVAPDMQPLYERLREVRRTRWPEETVLVFDLDARVEDDEIVFSFRLTWDEGLSFHPCEITWEQPVARAPDLN